MLLDWIWACSCPTSAPTAGWTLARFLRSDEFYSRWQFAEATRVAVERSDTELLQWLVDHFQDVVVPSDVVALAVLKGDLAVLHFLAANANTKVWWDPRDVLYALQNDWLTTANWLHQHAPLGTMTDEVRDDTITAAVNAGDVALCESLLPRGRCVLDYAKFCVKPDIIEWKLDCGYFWVGQWHYTLAEACRHGNLDVIKFLVDHPTGQQVIDEMGRSRELSSLVCFPAAKGNNKAMQGWRAIRAGDGQRHLDVASWLMR
ncbi:hypothetical protein PHYSODRAFT_288746 [Phytophthora sojae]|uniref:Ankyrin repeat protein n=1 Tax=Phytophthora sojae (strain P6497) TaxID=1094619 RepID=G5A5G4_PHYSP|nr:hypothetical protein PHYSODRAFT_288746 [Phytophthora sojae]EGZ09348.1 hypothetical protein PHYSODRAFT_288746 [Phytophthora sojae]|eukprot:XP_009535981.1 hypothetical protein PHYSODRAFT_288746 [Phytophthora sojae]